MDDQSSLRKGPTEVSSGVKRKTMKKTRNIKKVDFAVGLVVSLAIRWASVACNKSQFNRNDLLAIKFKLSFLVQIIISLFKLIYSSK